MPTCVNVYLLDSFVNYSYLSFLFTHALSRSLLPSILRPYTSVCHSRKYTNSQTCYYQFSVVISRYSNNKVTTKKKKNLVYEIYTWLHMNIMRAFFTYVRVISLRGTIVSRRRSLVTLSVTNWACKFSNFMAGQWVD